MHKLNSSGTFVLLLYSEIINLFTYLPMLTRVACQASLTAGQLAKLASPSDSIILWDFHKSVENVRHANMACHANNDKEHEAIGAKMHCVPLYIRIYVTVYPLGEL